MDLFNDVLVAENEGTTTLYAQWTPDTYEVTFNSNGGSGDAMVPQSVTYGTGALPLRANTYTKDGYTFKEWNSQADGQGKTLTSVQDLTDDLTVYAIWTKSYTVSFDLDGGTGTASDYKAQTVLSGALVTKPANDPTKAGYDFVEWQLDGKPFDFTAKLTDKTADKSEFTLTASWKAHTYKVQFVSNYGSGYKSATGSQDFTYGTPQALANPTTFAMPGYVQTGWNTKATGQGTTYPLGMSVDHLTTENNGTVTLYAIWAVNSTYKVSYNLGKDPAGALRSDIDNPRTGVKWTDGKLLPSENPTREGYAFAGWVNSDGSGVDADTLFNELPECVSDTGDAQEPADNTVTLTATWIPYTEAPAITTDADLGAVTLGAEYSKTFAFTGVPATGTWSVVPSDTNKVPDGLTFDAETATLSGTPTTAGTYTFELSVDNKTGIATKAFTLKVEAKTSITTEDINSGLVGEEFSQKLEALGENVTWSVAAGDLPDGITLAADGTLSGTPESAGSFVFAATATSATTGSDTQIYQFDVYQAPTITTKAIPDMVVGTAVSQQLEAKAEPVDCKWSIKSGSMPTGLKLSEGGLLSGTPTTAGTYTFEVAATNTEGTGTQSFTVKVADDGVEMFRLYNPNSGEHFFTNDSSERDNLKAAGWKYEGVAWTAPRTGDPVYRLYNANGGEHHYTMSTSERDNLVKAGWKDEGVGWYSDSAKTTPVYRVYNPNAFSNNHHYTTDATERDTLVKAGWKDEGIGWYGM